MKQGVTETVVIDRRFRGPPGSANGGYACGILAARLGGAVEVTLRAPLPLDEELQIAGDEARLSLRHGETLLAEARASEVDVVVPLPATLEEAAEAASRSRALANHPYPTCFGCGPEREEPDGLRLFPGQVGERALAACTWTPAASLADGQGQVPAEVVWVVLDCPTYWGGDLLGERSKSMLGRLTGEVVSPVEAGEPLIVIGWPIAVDGRKWEGGAALFTEAGELKACSRGLWIELRE
jgi:hypothetical protein